MRSCLCAAWNTPADMTVAVEVFNYGNPRIVPTCVGNIYVPRTTHGPTAMRLNKRAAVEINDYPMMEVKGLEAAAAEPLGVLKIDYSKYSIQDLRSLAASLGIAGFFTMKKVDLITKLEEKQ